MYIFHPQTFRRSSTNNSNKNYSKITEKPIEDKKKSKPPHLWAERMKTKLDEISIPFLGRDKIDQMRDKIKRGLASRREERRYII